MLNVAMSGRRMQQSRRPRRFQLQTTSNRRQQQTPVIVAGPLLLTGLAIAAMLTLWIVGGALFAPLYARSSTAASLITQRWPSSMRSLLSLRSDRGAMPPTLQTQQQQQLDRLREMVDIWPSRSLHPSYADFLRSCLPHGVGSSSCQIRLPSPDQVERIGILHTPGWLGDAMRRFVIDRMDRNDDGTTLEFAATSQLDTIEHTVSRVIRLAIIPPILEAIDLALLTTGVDFPSTLITAVDLIGVLRQVIRWHCQLSQHANHSALLTVSLDQIMMGPIQSKQQIREFLDLTPGGDDKIEMDGMAKQARGRIEAAIAVVQDLGDQLDIKSFRDLIDQAEQQEISVPSCRPVGPMGEPNDIPKSRITEIVGQLLGKEPHASNQMCKKYPQAAVCKMLETGSRPLQSR